MTHTLYMLLYSLLGVAQATLLTANLTLQVASDNPVSLLLNDYLVGNNLTYNVSGEYYNSSGAHIPLASGPSLSQGMSLVWSRAKGPTLDVTAIVQDAQYQNVIYTLDDSAIVAWNLSAFPVLKEIAFQELSPEPQFAYPFVGVDRLGCVLLVASAVYEVSLEESLFVQAVCLNGSALQYYINLTEPMPIHWAPLWVDFQHKSDMLYIYVLEADSNNLASVSIYGLSEDLSSPVEDLAVILPEDLKVKELKPIRFVGLGSIGVLCDSSGLFVLNMTNVTTKPPKLMAFMDTLNGPVLDCVAFNNFLLVTTYQGISNYSISDKHPQLLFQANQPLVEYSIDIGHFTQFSPCGQVVALYLGEFNPTSRPSFSFVVINAAAQDLREAVVLGNNTSELLGADAEEYGMPPFLLVEWEEHMYVIFNSLTHLFVYQIYRLPTLLFEPGIKGPYSYIGQVRTDMQSFPINVTAVDIHSPALYQRVPLPPLELTHYLDSSDHVYTDIYFPVSSYLFGPNLTYTLDKVSASYSNSNVTLPPMVSTNQTIVYPTKSLAKLKAIDLGTEAFVALVSNNSVQLSNCMETNLTSNFLASLQPSQPSFQVLDFAFVIIGSTAFRGLVIVSALNSTVAFDLFNLSKPSSPLLVSTLNRTMSPPIRVHGSNGFVYMLLPNSILVLELASSSSLNYPLVKFHTISVATIVPRLTSFVPVDFTSSINSTLLWINEQQLGLTYVDMMRSSQVFELKVVGYAGGSEMLAVHAVGAWLWVFVTGGPIYQLVGLALNITGSYQVARVFPSLPYCTYAFPVTANVYVALICANQTTNQVLIFDSSSAMPDSLVTAIWTPAPVSIALSYLSSSLYYLFTYDGQTFTRYQIGQSAINWLPASQLFTNTYGTAVWARCTLYFTEPPDALQFTLELNLTASNSLGQAQSLALLLIVENPGTFIITNPAGNDTSLLVLGQTQLYTSLQNYPLPISYFIGLDVTFSIYVNNNVNSAVQPSDFCDPSSYFVCLTDKSSLCYDCYDPLVDSDIVAFQNNENTMMYFASENLITAQLRSILEGQLPLHFNISELLNFTSSECYLFAHVQNTDFYDIVTAACVGLTSANVTSSFLLLLNITEIIPFVGTQPLGFSVTMLSAVLSNDQVLVFVSDGASIYVYRWTGLKFKYYSTITAESLGLTWLAPSSLQLVNDTLFALGDQNNGVVLLRLEESNKPVFKVDEMVPLIYGDNSVVALRVYTKTSLLYVLTRQGHFSKFSLSSRPATFVQSVNPVESGEFVPYINTIDTDVQFNYVAYLVQAGGELVVRVLDLFSHDWHSTVYTSVSTGVTTVPNRAYMQVITPDNEMLRDTDIPVIQVAVLMPGVLNYTTYVVSFQTTLTVSKGYNKQMGNFTLQLVASNSMSKAEAPPFTVYFNQSDTDEGGEIAHFSEEPRVYQKWWFWACIGFGLIVSFTAASLLLIKYYHRGKPAGTRASIALTTTDHSSLLIS